MVDTVSRGEFTQLESRVRVLEREAEGEKRVSRYILEQVRLNGDDLAAIKGRLDRLEVRFGGLETKVDGLETKVDGLEGKVDVLESKMGIVERKVDDLARTIPAMVADAVREVWREMKS